MNWLEFCSVIGVSTILATIINIIFSYFEKRKMFRFEKIIQEKEHRYQATMAFMLIVLDAKNITHIDISDIKMKTIEKMTDKDIVLFFKEKLKAHYSFSHLYASDDVLKCLKIFIDNPTSENYQKTAMAMRNDLWK